MTVQQQFFCRCRKNMKRPARSRPDLALRVEPGQLKWLARKAGLAQRAGEALRPAVPGLFHTPQYSCRPDPPASPCGFAKADIVTVAGPQPFRYRVGSLHSKVPHDQAIFHAANRFVAGNSLRQINPG